MDEKKDDDPDKSNVLAAIDRVIGTLGRALLRDAGMIHTPIASRAARDEWLASVEAEVSEAKRTLCVIRDYLELHREDQPERHRRLMPVIERAEKTTADLLASAYEIAERLQLEPLH